MRWEAAYQEKERDPEEGGGGSATLIHLYDTMVEHRLLRHPY